MTLKTSILMTGAAAAMVALASCSTIDAPDRFIEVEAPVVERHVLLFDFTGQQCTNCPSAHKVLEALEEQYGADLIAVAIHAGHFGVPDNPASPIVGLLQPEGTTLAEHWKIDAYPAGVVDGQGPYDSDKWGAAVREAVQQPSHLTITIDDATATADGQFSATYTVEAGEKFTGTVSTWVLQNSIRAMQVDGGKLIPDYEHKNVFRMAAGPLWGEPTTIGAFESVTATATAALKSHWDASAMSVVVFATDDQGRILQSAKAPVQYQGL